MRQLLMDLDFDIFFYCWGEFSKCSVDSVGVYTFLFISKIHPITEIRDRNLSPSIVVTCLYVGTCLWLLSWEVKHVHNIFFWKKGRRRKKLIIVLYRVSNIDWWIFLLLHFLCTLYICMYVVTESRVSLAQKKVKPFQTSSRGGENLFCTALTRSNRLWFSDKNITYAFEFRVPENPTRIMGLYYHNSKKFPNLNFPLF